MHYDLQLKYRAGVAFPKASPRTIHRSDSGSPGTGAARYSRASLQLVLFMLGQSMHWKMALTRP